MESGFCLLDTCTFAGIVKIPAVLKVTDFQENAGKWHFCDSQYTSMKYEDIILTNQVQDILTHYRHEDIILKHDYILA